MDGPGPLDIKRTPQDRFDDPGQSRLDDVPPKGLVSRRAQFEFVRTVSPKLSAMRINREYASPTTKCTDQQAEDDSRASTVRAHLENRGGLGAPGEKAFSERYQQLRLGDLEPPVYRVHPVQDRSTIDRRHCLRFTGLTSY